MGLLESRMLADCRAEVVLTGWPEIRDRHLRMLGATNRIILELGGRKNLKQQSSRTPDGGRFELHWSRG